MLEFQPVRGRRSTWLYLIVLFIFLSLLIPFGLIGREVWAVSTMTYDLTPDAVLITYGADVIRVDRAAVTNPRLVSPSSTRKLNGTGMPGAYSGRWQFAEFGQVRLYATRLEQVVLLPTPDQTWAVSPAEPEAFLNALQAGGTGQWQPARGESPWLTAAVIGFIDLLVFVIVAAILVYYARLPRTIRYALTDEGLRVEGGRLRLLLPYDRITSVEQATPAGHPWRKFGASLPGLHWGHFSWRSVGGPLRLYATALKPLVLVRTGQDVYGLTPEEPERFVTELSRRISPMGGHRP
ncbi:MAG TPA: PH domain-containing protein [Symbiobacteriaceae bacterium]|nr:PH domain-containing protein [Symbiobacteriaceae bacterium]